MIRQDLAYVQNYSKSIGSIGQSKYDEMDGNPIPVPCNVYPLTAAEMESYGLQLIETRSVICDAWPGDIHSRITFDGAEWDQYGPVKTYDKSWGVRSVQVIIKKRG